MEIDQGKLMEYLPMGLLLLMLFIMPLVPDAYRTWFFVAAIGSFGLSIFYNEYGLEIIASKYLGIRMIVRPTNEIINFFIHKTPEGMSSQLVDPSTNRYETPLEAEEKASHSYYGQLTKITLQHELPWEKRMLFLPGKIMFRGVLIDHNSVCTITVWEKREDTERVDHLEPIPTFVVAEAPRDIHLLNEPLTVCAEIPTATLALNGGGSQQTVTEFNLDYKGKYDEFKTRYNNEHQRSIRLESQVSQLKNEFHGLTGKEADTNKLVMEQLHTLLSAHIDITEVAGMKHNWFKFGKWMAIALIGVVGMVLLATQEGLRAWIGNNQLMFIIIVLVGGFVVYWTMGRNKS